MLSFFWVGALTTLAVEAVFILLIAILGGNQND